MPEVHGIVRTDALSPDESDGADRMGGELARSPGAKHQQRRESWARIGVVKLHQNDPAVLLQRPGEPTTWAWAGAPVEGDPTGACDALERSFTSGDEGRMAHLEWPFVLCRMDSATRTVWLVSDPFGLHPLYYYAREGLLAFSTKFLSLLRSGLIPWRLDREAMLDFFTFEHVTGDRTFADTVRVLPPATILCFRAGRAVLTRYDEPLSCATADRSGLKATAERLHHELRESVRRAAGSGRRIGIPLSGGLDSRAILGCALELGVKVKAFTFGRPASRDAILAAQLARRCGVPHMMVQTDGGFLPRWMEHGVHITGGMVNCIHWHILTLAEILEEEIDVVLDGLGGDAWTGGHLKWGMALARSVEAATEAVWRQRATAFHDSDMCSTLFEPDVLSQTAYDPRDSVARHMGAGRREPHWFGCHRFDILERQRRFIQYGPHLLRPRLDVRTPFYSHGLTRLLVSCPLSHLMEQRAYLLAHRRNWPVLASVPDGARNLPLSWPVALRFGGKLCDAVRRRIYPTHAGRQSAQADGVTDYAGWFRHDLRHFVTQRLLDSAPVFDGLLKRSTVERLLREHLAGRTDHAARIGCLLTFSTFCQTVRAGAGPKQESRHAAIT